MPPKSKKSKTSTKDLKKSKASTRTTLKKSSKTSRKKSPDSVIMVLPDIDIDEVDLEDEDQPTAIEIPWLEKFKPKKSSPARPHGNNVEYLVTAKPLLELLLSPDTTESRQTASPADRSQYAFSKYLLNIYNEYKLRYKSENRKNDPISQLIFDLGINDQVQKSLENLQDESICYICDQVIPGKTKTKNGKKIYEWNQGEMEAEHILPFAYAAQYSCIPSKNMLKIKEYLNLDDEGNLFIQIPDDKLTKDGKLIFFEDGVETIINNNEIVLNKWQVLLTLIEMRVSHKCCNQVKKASLFIKRDEDNGNLYIMNNDIVNFFNAIIKQQSYGCPKVISGSPLVNKKGRQGLINTCIDTYFSPICRVINSMEDAMKNDWYEFDRRVYPCSLYDKESNTIEDSFVVPSLENIEKGSIEWRNFIEWNRLIRISNFFNYMPNELIQQIRGDRKYIFQQPYEIRDGTINLINEKLMTNNEIKDISKYITEVIQASYLVDTFKTDKVIEYMEKTVTGRMPKRINVLLPKFISVYVNSLVVDNNLINTAIYIFSHIYSLNVKDPIISGIALNKYKDEILEKKSNVMGILYEIIVRIMYYELLKSDFINETPSYEEMPITTQFEDFNIIKDTEYNITYKDIIIHYTNPIKNDVYIAEAFFEADKLLETAEKVRESQLNDENTDQLYEGIDNDNKEVLKMFYNNKYNITAEEPISQVVNLKEECKDSYVDENENIEYSKRHQSIIKQGERNMQRMLEQQQQNNPTRPSIMNQDNDILTAAQDLLGLRKSNPDY